MFAWHPRDRSPRHNETPQTMLVLNGGVYSDNRFRQIRGVYAYANLCLKSFLYPIVATTYNRSVHCSTNETVSCHILPSTLYSFRATMEFPIKTDALVTEAPGSGYKMMPVFIDELRPNEVLVEMRYSGLCHTVGPSFASKGSFTDTARIFSPKGAVCRS